MNARLVLCKIYPVRITRVFSSRSTHKIQDEVYVDQIGRPDPISNLRPIIFKRRHDETELEKTYREAREDTQLWNQLFWTNHNNNFVKERKQFQDTLKAQGKTTLTADEMSVFYKHFLDKNWKMHLDYNISWYKRNLKLLFLEIRVKISKSAFG